jgi:DNA-binding response OmpR family regulator
MIIDDDPAMTDLLQLILNVPGAEVTIANTGQKGLDLVRENCPDILILDMMIPDTDGRTICKEIRKFSSIPILILSALNSPNVIASSLDAGADDYLVKPVPNTVLLSHIQNLVKRNIPDFTFTKT